MDLVVFSPAELFPVLRALRSVTSADGVFTPSEARFIEAIATLHGVTIDPLALDPISLEAMAAAVVDPHKRKRAVQLAIVAALIEGTPDPRARRAVGALARVLDVPDSGLRVLNDLASDHSIRVRLDMLRRLGGFVSRTVGLSGILWMALPSLGIGGDLELEARFRRLGRLEPGTLGRAIYDQYDANDFAFPGTPGGVPERFLFHDVGHVLSGYGVDPHGEIQQAAFQAGFVRDDGFVFLLFGILQFHLGIRLTPIAPAESGHFDVGRVMRAAARGASCKIDLSVDFDVWGHAHEQVDDLRRTWGIPPL